MQEYPEPARTKDDPRYHQVVFGPGPQTGERQAICGLTARFYPRIGIRMEDRVCVDCLRQTDPLGQVDP